MSHRPAEITRRRFLGTAAATGAATLLGPGARMASAQGAKPTISFWNGLTGADGKVMGELIAQFTKETGIQVELQMIV
jgi:ABC-type glycerol-3-phosphate transport system substrate-binding protein